MRVGSACSKYWTEIALQVFPIEIDNAMSLAEVYLLLNLPSELYTSRSKKKIIYIVL